MERDVNILPHGPPLNEAASRRKSFPPIKARPQPSDAPKTRHKIISELGETGGERNVLTLTCLS